MEISDTNKETAGKPLQPNPKKCSMSSMLAALTIIVLVSVVYYTVVFYPKLRIHRKLVLNHTITPTISGQVFLLILINSIPKTASRRQVLRETWAGTANAATPAKSLNTQNKFTDHNVQVFCMFLVGISVVESENRELELEAYYKRDILRINTEESYRNMINKVWGGFQWALKIKPKYVMKVDDDIYVDIPHLITWLYSLNLPTKLYSGWVLHHGRVMRSPGNQWYVSHAQFHEHVFPDYCIGPFYIFSGNLLDQLIQKSTQIKKFSVEDAYFGILMRSLHIAPVHSNHLFVWEPRLVNMLPKWEDKKFSDVICLGERLESKLIRFIHSKYQKIKGS